MKRKSKSDKSDATARVKACARLAKRYQTEMFFAFGPVYDLTHTPPKPPANLYHYTNAQGLIGIIESGVLHASNLKAVNDKGELEYGFDLIKKALIARAVSFKEGTIGRKLFQHYTEFVNPYAVVGQYGLCLDVYSVAFCEEGDSLPQWRAYSERCSGCSIGFSGFDLSKTFDEGIVLVPVIYDQEQQSEIIGTLMKALESVIPHLEVANECERDMCFTAATYHVGLLFSYIGTVFKSPDFRSEREWRIIVHNEVMIHRHAIKTHFRVSQNGTIIPFVKIEPKRKKRLPIVSVTLGSTAPSDVNSYSVRLLLNSHSYQDAQVLQSAASIRY